MAFGKKKTHVDSGWLLCSIHKTFEPSATKKCQQFYSSVCVSHSSELSMCNCVSVNECHIINASAAATTTATTTSEATVHFSLLLFLYSSFFFFFFLIDFEWKCTLFATSQQIDTQRVKPRECAKKMREAYKHKSERKIDEDS